MNYESYIYGEKEADTILIQMVDDHELEEIDREISFIKKLSPGKDFCLLAVKVNDWNHDLSPWTAQAVFGKEGFAGKAEETLHILLKEILPGIVKHEDKPEKKLIVGGYSLAGFSRFGLFIRQIILMELRLLLPPSGIHILSIICAVIPSKPEEYI